jgi:hypothetical protein
MALNMPPLLLPPPPHVLIALAVIHYRQRSPAHTHAPPCEVRGILTEGVPYREVHLSICMHYWETPTHGLNGTAAPLCTASVPACPTIFLPVRYIRHMRMAYLTGRGVCA